MTTIPTAEETLKNWQNKYQTSKLVIYDSLIDVMKEFAKLHVEAALKAASEKAKLKIYPYNGCFECGRSDMDIDKESILNAYTLDQIK